jgi:hypothetical protein
MRTSLQIIMFTLVLRRMEPWKDRSRIACFRYPQLSGIFGRNSLLAIFVTKGGSDVHDLKLNSAGTSLYAFIFASAAAADYRLVSLKEGVNMHAWEISSKKLEEPGHLGRDFILYEYLSSVVAVQIEWQMGKHRWSLHTCCILAG